MDPDRLPELGPAHMYKICYPKQYSMALGSKVRLVSKGKTFPIPVMGSLSASFLTLLNGVEYMLSFPSLMRRKGVTPSSTVYSSRAPTKAVRAMIAMTLLIVFIIYYIIVFSRKAVRLSELVIMQALCPLRLHHSRFRIFNEIF